MLKFVIFLCVLQLGAATPSMCESDFAENEIPPSSYKSGMVRMGIETSYRKYMWELAEDYYRKAVEKRNKIAQEAASPDQVERLQQANKDVALAQNRMSRRKAIYDDAVLRD